MKSEDSLTSELNEIDSELEALDQQIIYIEIQKANLLERKKAIASKLKESQPTSSGGAKQDSTSDWNRNDFEWSSKVSECLRTKFKLETFRALQLETINVTLSKQDCLVIMPTGGGKSLCYQLPALIDSGVTLVVSPLVSLMEDQLWGLHNLNINAQMLTSTTTKESQKSTLAAMLDPKSDLRLLYVTPEKLAKSKMFMNKLEKMYDLNRFHRLVIDEVHCCSTYGHDFRPDYKFLGIMKRQFPNICILGLTATATHNVIDDIRDILSLNKFVLFKASFNRPNLYYEIRDKPSNHEACMNEIGDLIQTKFLQQSGIVYCFSQRESELVAADLRSRSIRADAYHAQIEPAQRAKVHNKWLKNETHVIVATIAFGMGIDKPNCRFVIHHSLSKSLENFYQESGRAGRDGNTAYSILFFRYADVFRQSSMVFTERTGLENLYSIVNYCFNKIVCKRQLVAEHFKDHLWAKTGNCHQMCDVCNKNQQTTEIDCIAEAAIVFDILNKHEGKDKRLTANKLAELTITGVKKSVNKLTKSQAEQLLLELLLNQFLREEFSYTPYSTICYLVKGSRGVPKISFKICVLDESGSDTGKNSLIKKKKSKSVVENFEDTEESSTSKNSIFKSKIKKKTVSEVVPSEFEELIVDEVKASSKRKSVNEVVILDSSDDENVKFVSKKNKN